MENAHSGQENTAANQALMDQQRATKELRAWVIKKTGHDRKLNDDVIDSLTQVMCEGRLILKEDLTAVYKLRHPLMSEVDKKEEVHLAALTFKARLKYSEVKNLLRHVHPDDVTGQGLAYTAGLTNVAMKKLEQLDVYDLIKVQSVVGFFIT